ncbi:hypothetical protein GCM10027402_17790 [Arthrobacter monumenti]
MSNKPPTELVTEFHKLAGQLVDLHGGQWTYGDGTTIWEKDRTDGYNAQPCQMEGRPKVPLGDCWPARGQPRRRGRQDQPG